MRIYEINEWFHIDLEKIVAIRQYMNRIENPKPARKKGFQYEFWIEVTIDSGRHIEIECGDIEKTEQTYDLLLRAWKNYVGDPVETSAPKKEIDVIQ